MTDSNKQDSGLPLLGIDFVFDMGLKKIEEQVKNIEALDVKVAVLLGFLGTILVGFLALVFAAQPAAVKTLVSWLTSTLLLVGLIFTGLALVNAFQAFRFTVYYGSPRFSDLFRWANEDPRQTKLVFLNTLLAAVNGNDKRLEDKQTHANRAGWLVLFAFLSFLFAIIEIGIRLLIAE